jgi:hypothetical protein
MSAENPDLSTVAMPEAHDTLEPLSIPQKVGMALTLGYLTVCVAGSIVEGVLPLSHSGWF